MRKIGYLEKPENKAKSWAVALLRLGIWVSAILAIYFIVVGFWAYWSVR